MGEFVSNNPLTTIGIGVAIVVAILVCMYLVTMGIAKAEFRRLADNLGLNLTHNPFDQEKQFVLEGDFRGVPLYVRTKQVTNSQVNTFLKYATAISHIGRKHLVFEEEDSLKSKFFAVEIQIPQPLQTKDIPSDDVRLEKLNKASKRDEIVFSNTPGAPFHQDFDMLYALLPYKNTDTSHVEETIRKLVYIYTKLNKKA